MTKTEVLEVLRDIANLRETKDIPLELVEKYVEKIDSFITSTSYEAQGNNNMVYLKDNIRSRNKESSAGDPYPF